MLIVAIWHTITYVVLNCQSGIYDHVFANKAESVGLALRHWSDCRLLALPHPS